MKKILFILLVIILLGIIWFNLPLEITRKSDINFGNKIIENIERYKKQHHELPTTDDWKTLENLGFKTELAGTKPYYEKFDDDEYHLIFPEGFDPPYLFYNSKLKQWKYDFPPIKEKKYAK